MTASSRHDKYGIGEDWVDLRPKGSARSRRLHGARRPRRTPGETLNEDLNGSHVATGRETTATPITAGRNARSARSHSRDGACLPQYRHRGGHSVIPSAGKQLVHRASPVATRGLAPSLATASPSPHRSTSPSTPRTRNPDHQLVRAYDALPTYSRTPSRTTRRWPEGSQRPSTTT